jgi:hypothetical protein
VLTLGDIGQRDRPGWRKSWLSRDAAAALTGRQLHHRHHGIASPGGKSHELIIPRRVSRRALRGPVAGTWGPCLEFVMRLGVTSLYSRHPRIREPVRGVPTMSRSRSCAMELAPSREVASIRLFCPTSPVNHWAGRATRDMKGGWPNWAGEDFPTKRPCALGLSAGRRNTPSAAQTRRAQPELDPRDDA